MVALLLLAACSFTPPMPEGKGIAFGLMGDTPYSLGEAAALDDMIDRINAEELAFVVHAGDITSGRGPCSDEWFLARKEQFQRLRHPFILIPGDNDWVDCHRSGMDPLERLARFRELFNAGDESLGQRTLKLERQSSDAGYAEYREHMRWTLGGVVFITLNVQGSNNNLGRNPAMDAEHHRRMQAALAWLADGAQLAAQPQYNALVIVTQANPDFEERRLASGRSDGYAQLREALRLTAQRLKKPVTFVHGDTHFYQQNQPLKDAGGATLANFTRVEVYGSPFVRWLRGTLFPSAATPVHIAPAP
jgi:hypothetical protein